VAKLVRIRQLGPEQLENQNRIRRQTQNVNDALDELEKMVMSLKDKVLEEKHGRSPLQAPSLDSIYRAIRHLTAGLHRKIIELDDVALRLDMISLSTETTGKPHETTPKASRLASSLVLAKRSASPLGSKSERSFTRTPKKHVAHATARIERNVKRTLAAEEFGQKLRDAWLANGRKEPLLNTSANAPAQ
jgi:nucleoporin NUP159